MVKLNFPNAEKRSHIIKLTTPIKWRVCGEVELGKPIVLIL